MFGELLTNVLAPVAASAATSGLLMWLFKEWLSTRLKAAIQHEYATKLETLKAQLKTDQDLAILNIQTTLSREATLHAAAHAAFAEGQKAAMERRLSAVDRLWSCVLQFRANLPPVLTFMDVLTIDEYKAAKDSPQFRALTSDLSNDKIAMLVPKGIEEVRPYIGENVWLIFYCYQTILLRVVALLNWARTDAEKIEWHKDGGTRQVMAAVLSEAELAEFDTLSFRKISWLQQQLEAKLLAAAQKVISGESFGADSLEQARLIQQRVAQISEATPVLLPGTNSFIRRER